MPAPLRDVPQDAIELIKAFEGIPDGDPSTVNLDAYLCPASVWTIGWGHAVMDGGAQLKGPAAKARARALYPGGITHGQAEALLRGDLVPRAASVSSLLKVTVDNGKFGWCSTSVLATWRPRRCCANSMPVTSQVPPSSSWPGTRRE